MRWIRAGKPPIRQFVAGIRAGEPIGKKEQICRECGKPFFAHGFSGTCSRECATRRRRRQQRDAKKKEWQVKRDQLIERQRLRYHSPAGQAYAKNRHRQRWAETASNPQALEAAREKNRLYYSAHRIAAGKAYRSLEEIRTARIVPVREKRTCVYCREVIKGHGRKFCNAQCAKWHRRIQRDSPLMTGLEVAALIQTPAEKVYFSNCAQCGTRFGATSIQSRFCSPECRLRSLAERKRKGPAQHRMTCRICGTSFVGQKRNAKYCSDNCRAEGKRRAMRLIGRDPDQRERQKLLHRRRKGITANCIVCGRDMSGFDDLRKHRYTCSPECRRRALANKTQRANEKRRFIHDAGTH